MTVPPLPRPLQRLLTESDGPLLVVHGPRLAGVSLGGVGGVHIPADQREPRTGRHPRVLLACADALELRRVASVLPPFGRSRQIALWLRSARAAPLLVPRPEWPALQSATTRTLPDGGALLSLRFERPAPVNAVVEEVARAVAPSLGPGDPTVLATLSGSPVAGAPAVDPAYQSLRTPDLPGPDHEPEVPPDVVLAERAVAVTQAYAVTGERPVVVSEPVLLDGPLDEGLLNPVGFVKRPTQEPVPLADLADLAGTPGAVGTVTEATPALVDAARDHSAVVVDWTAGERRATSRTAAGLAMAGVPLLGTPPADAERWLGPDLHRLLRDGPTPDDLADPLAREEHSIRLRRAAHSWHATWAWRRRVSAAAHRPVPAEPTCSVVLATKRPARLEAALRQVARQRGVAVELVLVAHGFVADPAVVESIVPGAVVLSRPAEVPFGSVLQAGLVAASGELVAKMDDDDWYGPDFLADLVLARRYSGADVVGTPAEYVYLEAVDSTIRRNDPSETYVRFVAGGTLLMGRDLLASVGGFRPVRRFADAQLLTAVLARGGTVYRAHGLGYVLRRGEEGHTWTADVDYFLDASRLDRRWPGFRPSRILEHP